MIRLLVTGASGFLGQHILNSVLSSGRYEIHAVTRRTSPQQLNGVRWHKADLTLPGEGLALLEEIAPSQVIHAAWTATPGEYLASPTNLKWLQASIAMMDAFGRSGGTRWLGIGSCAEYRPEVLPCAEDATPVLPTSVYGRCKASCSQALFAAAEMHGFSGIWARIFVPYGPGDNPRRLIPSLIDALSAGRDFHTSSGDQVRDFIYSEDVGRMIVELLESSSSGIFNIGTGRGVTVRSVVELVADQFGRRGLVRFGKRKLAPGEPNYLVADMSKTRDALHGLNVARIENTLKQIIDWR